jgi:hypothetical protein
MPTTEPNAMRSRRPITLFQRTAIILLLHSGALIGQPNIHNLSGTVTDHGHEPLRGAVVQVQEGGTQNVASYITDQHGHYRFRHLKGNTDYSVWATYRDHKSKEKSISQFDTKQDVTVDLTIDME